MTMLRDWARLDAQWYEDPVLLDAAEECVAAFHLWPVLIGKAKHQSHAVDNPEGVFSITPRRLALSAWVSPDEVRPALDALASGGLISYTEEGRSRFRISLVGFSKWQTPRKSNAEAQARKRWLAERNRKVISHEEVMEVSRVSHGSVMPDRDLDRDRDVDNQQQQPSCDTKPLPPNPRTIRGQIRSAERQLGSHVAVAIRNMIGRRNSDSIRMLTEGRELAEYWRPACELLDEYGADRLREAIDKAAGANAVRLAYVETVCKANQRKRISAVAADPDLAAGDWSDYTGGAQ